MKTEPHCIWCDCYNIINNPSAKSGAVDAQWDIPASVLESRWNSSGRDSLGFEGIAHRVTNRRSSSTQKPLPAHWRRRQYGPAVPVLVAAVARQGVTRRIMSRLGQDD